jgi:uncharacterized membrane protein
MISKWRWILLQLTRQLWLRAALFAVLGVLTALAAIAVERYIPWRLPTNIGAEAVSGILNILASSMLAVTTFSLGVMVTAYGAATTNVTPRATKLLMQDSTTQNVLAAFLGSFLFSLVGIVTLSAGAYGERGRVVLFVVTLIVIGTVVFTILRWIEHLTRLGRVGETTRRVEEAALSAMRARAKAPHLGAQPLSDLSDVPAGAHQVMARGIGYIQNIDVQALDDWAKQKQARIFLATPPGAFVHQSRVLAWVADVTCDEADEEAVFDAFRLDDERTFDQDPRFGLSVLAEIASRALSPAINDPGTAIDVLGRMVRVLALWAEREPADTPPCAQVWAPTLADADLLDDAFQPIARDGAGLV